jgi:hypothetical protein
MTSSSGRDREGDKVRKLIPNRPVRTPNHPEKSHMVLAKVGDKEKLIRFGQQGVQGSPDGSARNEAFKARHAKNIAKGKMSAAFWADRTKW